MNHGRSARRSKPCVILRSVGYAIQRVIIVFHLFTHHLKAYDTRLSMKADPQRVSEEFVRRTTERREWARKQQEEVQKRTDAFQEKIRREREAKELAKARELEEAAMAADILKDMYQHTPGLMERREAALRVRSSFQIFYQIRPSRFPSERPSANVQSVAAVDNSSDRNVR
jgi:hypothetical protein